MKSTRGLGLILLLGSCAAAHGATIRVPEDQPSVLAGVDAAAPGDTVLVGPGTWTDRETRLVSDEGFLVQVTACAFPDHGLTLMSTSGATSTTLDLGSPGPGDYDVVVRFIEPDPGRLVIEGFTLTWAPGVKPRSAIGARDCDGLVVRACRFLGQAGVADDYAIAGGNLPPTPGLFEIYDSSIENFTSPTAVSVLYSSVHMANCTFRSISGRCIQVDNEYAPNARVVIDGCTFEDCRGPGYGVAADIYLVNDFTIRNCRFERVVSTSQETSGAVRIAWSEGVLEFCTFINDSALAFGGQGGGVVTDFGDAVIRNNTFVGCYAQYLGAAIAHYSGNASVANNLVIHCGGGPAYMSYTPGQLYGSICNLMWENSGGDYWDQWASTSGDLSADPLFCDEASGDFTVREDSPCIVAGCEQIGAFGVGCTKVSIESKSWGRIKGLYR